MKGSFEEKLAELDKIVEILESDDVDLKTAVENYKNGIKIIKECEKDLGLARKELRIINSDEAC